MPSAVTPLRYDPSSLSYTMVSDGEGFSVGSIQINCGRSFVVNDPDIVCDYDNSTLFGISYKGKMYRLMEDVDGDLQACLIED